MFCCLKSTKTTSDPQPRGNTGGQAPNPLVAPQEKRTTKPPTFRSVLNQPKGSDTQNQQPKSEFCQNTQTYNRIQNWLSEVNAYRTSSPVPAPNSPYESRRKEGEFISPTYFPLHVGPLKVKASQPPNVVL